MILLIVDDEPIIRRSLVDILPWKNLGFDRVLCAQDAWDAKRYFEREVPEIMICDIEMPGMDGLELSEWVHQNYTKTVILLLTCHASFSYAQIAIRYGVMDYLLKPVSPVALENCIHKALGKIKEERLAEENAQGAVRWEKSRSVVKDGFWQDVIRHQLDRESIISHASELGLEIDPDAIFLPVLFSWFLDVSREGRAALREVLESSNTECAWVTVDDRRVAAIFSCVNNISNERIKEKILQHPLLPKIILRCAVGNQVQAVQIAESIRQLISFSESCVSDDFSFLLLETANVDRVKQRIELPPLETWIREDTISEIFAGKILLWIDSMVEQKKMWRQDLIRLQNRVEQVLLAYLKERGIDTSGILSGEEMQNLQKNAVTRISDMKRYLKKLLTESEGMVRQQYDRNPVTEKIKQYIEEQYDQPVTRVELAARVYLNPDYVDRVFKRVEGMSVNRYLNLVRMKKAEQLLETTHMKVVEIASQVGFSSLSSFNTQFRQYCGMSPVQYRKKFRHG